MPSLTSNLYDFGEFRLDAQKRLLRRGAETVALTPKAFDVLLLLIQHSGEVVTKDQIMRAVWPDSFVEESNLTQTIFMLRKALAETQEQRYILTLQGQGYRFVADVKEVFPGQQDIPDRDSQEDVTNFVAPNPNAVRPDRLIALARTQTRNLLRAGAVLIVSLVIASLAYVGWTRSQRKSAPAGTRLMLAVLPFQNLTGDATQEYFSDGLTEEMITQLGNLDSQHLGVIARTSVMHYKGTSIPLDQIGRELGVQYVIEGSVRRDANDVRITAQLIQMKDQSHVWARQYDRELKGLLTVQSEIAHAIADEIEVTLGENKSALATEPTILPHNYEAYDLYLKGQYFFNKRTAAGLTEAIEYFQQATAKDPSYARAYAGLADCYTLMSAYTARPPTDLIPKARGAALQALQLDDRLPEAHTALALIVQTYDWDWPTAEKEFQRAIALNPNYATAHHWYGEHLMWRGRFDEALLESERARQLDPLSLIIAADNGAILYFSRQYDGAIEKWQSVLELDPDFSRAHLIRGAYVEKGMFSEALTDVERFRPNDAPAGYWSWRAYIAGHAGHAADARFAMGQLLELNRHKPVDPLFVANAYAGMGEKDEALAWLEKASTQHSNELVTLKVSPIYDPLRDDLRFQNLVRRIGL